MGRIKVVVDLLAGVALIAASAIVIRSSLAANTPAGAPPKLEGKFVSLKDSASMGDATAPVGIIVFSDFECPFCGKFAQETQDVLADRYVKTGKVRLAFRHFPLAMHKNAQLAARAVECARPEDRFWQLHDVLFANQKQINATELSRFGIEAGLSDAWRTCAISPTAAAADAVAKDLSEANAIGIASTPTILIGELSNGMVKVRTVIGGAKPASDFTAAVDRLLKQ
jgi:protein-disulfide isomerase